MEERAEFTKTKSIRFIKGKGVKVNVVPCGAMHPKCPCPVAPVQR